MNLEDELYKNFGYSEFRNNQKEVICNILKKSDTFNILPTSFGKSICFQLPALLSEGLTIVITPLISLMVDQVFELKKLNIKCAYLNSKMTYQEVVDVYNAFSTMKLIYISPERMGNKEFLVACSKVKISYIIVDEAHTIAKWGNDFRKSFAKIGTFRNSFDYHIPLSAFTATVTELELKSIISSLKMKNLRVINSNSVRNNLLLSIIKTNNKLVELEKIFKQDGCKIIYASSIKNVMMIYEYFRKTHSITYYHGKLNQEIRNNNQAQFITNKVKVIVATNAFGMGINKKDIRYVVHYEISSSISDYVQEFGRAGRDGFISKCIVLSSAGDLNVHYFLANKSYAESKNKVIYLQRLRDIRAVKGYLNTKLCLNQFLQKKFNNKEENCCTCSNCLNHKFEVEKLLLNSNYNLDIVNNFLLKEAIRSNNKFVSLAVDMDIVRKIRQLDLNILVKDIKTLSILRPNIIDDSNFKLTKKIKQNMNGILSIINDK